MQCSLQQEDGVFIRLLKLIELLTAFHLGISNVYNA